MIPASRFPASLLTHHIRVLTQDEAAFVVLCCVTLCVLRCVSHSLCKNQNQSLDPEIPRTHDKAGGYGACLQPQFSGAEDRVLPRASGPAGLAGWRSSGSGRLCLGKAKGEGGSHSMAFSGCQMPVHIQACAAPTTCANMSDTYTIHTTHTYSYNKKKQIRPSSHVCSY